MFVSRHLVFGVLCLPLFAALWPRPGHAQALTANAQPTASAGSVAAASATAAAKPVSSTNSFSVWNFSLNENVQHDSTTGWSDIVTPDLSVHPNRHVAFDVNVPWYPSLAAYTSTTVGGATTTTLSQQHNVIGDASASGHAGGSRGDFNFNAGAAVGFSTGDQSLGVGAGKTTWHFGTHSEYSIGPFTPDVEAGIGNSSALANNFVHKSYTAVGQMVNFQAGTSIDLPGKISADAELYEAMPIQLQNIFGTISRRGSQGHSGGKKTVNGTTGSGEDNGLNLGLEYPLTRRLKLAAEYDRSFIQADDIVGFSLTWVLRAPNNSEAGTPASPRSRH